MPPEEAIKRQLTAQQHQVIEQQSSLWLVGDPATLAETISEKARAAGADEVMITTTVYDYALRRRSYALLAQALGITPDRTLPALRVKNSFGPAL